MSGFNSPLGRNSKISSNRSKRAKSKKMIESNREGRKRNTPDTKNHFSFGIPGINKKKEKNRLKGGGNKTKHNRSQNQILNDDDKNYHHQRSKHGKNISSPKNQVSYKNKRVHRLSSKTSSFTNPKRSFRKSEHSKKNHQKVNKNSKKRTKRKSHLQSSAKKSSYKSPNKNSFLGFERINYKPSSKSKNLRGNIVPKIKTRKEKKKILSSKSKARNESPTNKWKINRPVTRKTYSKKNSEIVPPIQPKAKSTKNLKTPKSKKSQTQGSGEEFELNSETTDQNEFSMTYGARSELSAKKSALTVIRETQIKRKQDEVNKKKDNLIKYLLTERKEYLEKVEEQTKQLGTYKEEMRRVKTLSLYYPDNNDLIIEESDKSSSSYESSDEEDKKVMIASTQDIQELSSVKSNKVNPLRQTIDPLRASQNPSMAKTFDPLRSSQNPSISKNFDLLRNSANMEPTSDPLRTTNFSAPNIDPLRSTNYSSPPLTTKAESIYTTKEGTDPKEVEEFRKLSNNFMQHMAKQVNEENYKYAEFTLNKMDSLIQNIKNELIETQKKNKDLLSVITELKLSNNEAKVTKEEGENLIKAHEEGKLEVTQVETFYCDWEAMRTSLKIEEENKNQIKIPENLKKFEDKKKEKNQKKGKNSETGREKSPKKIAWGAKSTKSDKDFEMNDKKLSINSQDLFEFKNGKYTYNHEKQKLKKKKIMKIKNFSIQKNNSIDKLPMTTIHHQPQIQNTTNLNTGPQTQYFNVSINTNNPEKVLENLAGLGNNSSKLHKTNNFKYFFMQNPASVNKFFKFFFTFFISKIFKFCLNFF